MGSLSFLQILKSKTVWTVLAGVALQGVQVAAADPASTLAVLHLSPQANATATTVLGALAIAFRANPAQHPAPAVTMDSIVPGMTDEQRAAVVTAIQKAAK
jgi:hypothetical protein